MVGPLKPPKSSAEVKRKREVFKLYAAFQNIPHIANLGDSPDTHALPSDHVPKTAADASLAAFCQLAAMRLNAARSLISLIDDEYQYILAEATPKTSLRVGSSLNKAQDLGFGNVRLPRRWGVCEKVLDPTAFAEGQDIVIIKDFTKNEDYAKRSYVRDGPLRFYAGVPLVTKSGNIVGAVCILDNAVRDGLSQDDIIYLQDLAVIIMEYLVTYSVKDKYRRAAEGMGGLMSFAEGGSANKSFSFSDQKTPMGAAESGLDPVTPNQQEKGLKDPQTGTAMKIENDPQQYTRLASPSHESLDRRLSVSELQESLLSETTKELFARAADIMRQSNDMSGVMFMDASYAATGSQEPLSKKAGKHCQILGYATHDCSSLRGDILPTDMIPLESNFRRVLELYPKGYSLNCDGPEDSSHSEDSSPNDQFSYFADIMPKEQRLQTVHTDREQHSARVKALIPNIKSALFLPLWDFERGRWFSGCFCWSTRAERVLDGRLDLPFLKAFGHSIMQEVARLDAVATSQSKTTFLSSLSHELRTPLHGILGSAHLMRNSRLDTFQVSMLNSINVCGRTLLETVEHLLDHAERPEKSQNYASITSYGENSISIASERLHPANSNVDSSAVSKCNVGFITEEVVETMNIGEAPFNITVDSNEDGSTAMDEARSQEIAKKRSRFIILDVSDYRGLGFRLSPSSYGRIVMNLFGNALKFTQTGYVHISVRSEDISDHTGTGTVVLKVSDSGCGMAAAFLQGAFEPFRKQNQHTTGTGVGLSVVKRIIEDVGGQIDVSSQPSKGTDIVLKLPLERLSDEEGRDPTVNPLPAAMAGLKGRKVCILYQGSEPNESAEQAVHKQTLKRYVEVLSETLSKVLQLDIHHTSIWDGSDETEVVICPEVSFESLQTIRRNAVKAGRPCPATIIIAMDILEAETLRSDARVTSQESIVQSTTQPCGPYKLAVVINACLHQYENAHPHTATSSAGHESIPLSPVPRKHRFSQFGPKLGLYPPPLALRTKSNPAFDQVPTIVPPALPLPEPNQADESVHPRIENALIVDDNSINRRLLSTWTRRRKMPFKEAKDGQVAVDAYKEANPPFDIILMDISMPVMDGMTATRLIRDYEKEKGLKPAHIIALTGLTSASARLEAWTSGVDDFLTKPVDFKKLERLMEVGRGGEGTGFMKEQANLCAGEGDKYPELELRVTR